MNIKLGHLERGQYRELFPDEVESLRKLLADSTNLPKSEQMKLEAEKKAEAREKRSAEAKDGAGKKETRPRTYNSAQGKSGQKPAAEKKFAQKKPEAFKEGNKVFRTVPKFYPKPETAADDKH